MKRAILLLFFLLFVFPSSVLANTFSSVNLGTLKSGTLKLYYDDAIINTYMVFDTNYVAISDLQYLGCEVTYSPADKTIYISSPTYGQSVPLDNPSLDGQPFSIYSGQVILDQFQTQCINSNGRNLIPLAALNTCGVLTISDDCCYFSPAGTIPISVRQDSISNLEDSPFHVSVLDIYWQDGPILSTTTYELDPLVQITRTPPVTNEKAFYIASIVQSVQGESYTYTNTSYLGQLNQDLFHRYSEVIASPNAKTQAKSIEIPSAETLEAFVNGKNLSSPTKYLVWTDTSKQYTYIFRGSKNNWKLYKSFICSTGKDSTPTPKGLFALTYKVPSFGQNKGYCCKYAFGFIGTTYLYHSIIFDKTGTYLLENKGVLGQKASDGCIRFSEEDAYWFYTNMITKTTVYIN